MAPVSNTPASSLPFNPALRAYGQGAYAPQASRVSTGQQPLGLAGSRAAQVSDRVDFTRPTAPAATSYVPRAQAPAIPQAPVITPAKPAPKVESLIAGRVSQGIDFSGPEPKPALAPIEAARAAATPAAQEPQVTGASLIMQLYRHPADKVQAATDVAVGRVLDRLA